MFQVVEITEEIILGKTVWVRGDFQVSNLTMKDAVELIESSTKSLILCPVTKGGCY